MTSPEPPLPPMPFSDFPEDVQLSILSFLCPTDVATFACTSRRSASLCSQTRLWFTMCDRRWGHRTQIRTWGGGGGDGGGGGFTLLYRALDSWENFIGFWRRIGRGAAGTPPLVFFEWGPSFITGSRVSPSPEPGSYGVAKTPFLWMGLSPRGDPVSFVHPSRRFDCEECLEKLTSGSVSSDEDLVPVTVSFLGSNHFVVEEKRSCYGDARGAEEFGSSEDLVVLEESSPPDRLMAEIYQYFANRTCPGGDKAFWKQRKKERNRLGRRRWEAEYFVKFANCPTPTRPLQGPLEGTHFFFFISLDTAWKGTQFFCCCSCFCIISLLQGICENMCLDFYLVTYDDVGGVACRKVGGASEPFSGYSPVFWASNTTFLERPFSKEEEDIYAGREHIQPLTLDCTVTERVISSILCMNSSHDLVVPDSSGSSVHPQNVEGLIWEYGSGTFGFGFLRNNYIVDLKHIALNGCLLDTVEPPCKGSCL